MINLERIVGMALDKKQLTKVANLNPPTTGDATANRQLWHYESGADNVAAVVTAGYFNDVRGLLEAGDRIMLVANNVADFRMLKVTAAPATGNVTTAALAVS
jgi:hypothetical protein